MKRLFILLMLCLGLGILVANPVWDNKINLRNNLNADYSGCFATADDGTSIHVWSDISSGSRDIHAMRISADGQNMWAAPVAITSAPGNQDYPSIFQSSANEYIITYSDYQPGSNGALRAARINHNGIHLWGENGVMVSNLQSDKKDVHFLNQGVNIVIIWQDTSYPGYNIQGQKLDANGSRQWGNSGARLTFTSSLDTIWHILPDANDGFSIIYNYNYQWQLNSLLMTKYDSSANMQLVSPIVLLPESMDKKALNSLYIPGVGLYVLVREETAYTGNLHLHSFDPDWIVQEPITLDLPDTYIYNYSVHMKQSSDGQLIIAWIRNQLEPNRILQTRKYSPEGVLLWEADPVSFTTYDYDFVMAPDNTGGVNLAWKIDDSQVGSQIRASYINSAGNMIWTNENVASSDTHLSLRGASSSPNRFRILWHGLINAESGAFFQELNSSGTAYYYEGAKNLISGISGTVINNTTRVYQTENYAVYIWQDNRAVTPALYYQIIDHNGSVWLEENGRYLGDCESGSSLYDVVLTPDGRLGVTWIELLDSGNRRLKAQLIGANGDTMWGEGGLVLSDNIVFTALISYENDAFYVAWTSWEDTITKLRIQKISQGAIEWQDGGILVFEGSSDYELNDIECMLGNYLIFSTIDSQNSVNAGHIMKFNSDGSPAWDDAYINLKQDYQMVDISVDHRAQILDGNIHISWRELSYLSDFLFEIKTQMVSPDGELLTPNGVLVFDSTFDVDNYDMALLDDGIVHVLSMYNPSQAPMMQRIVKHNLDLEPVWSNPIELGLRDIYLNDQSLSAYDTGILGVGWRSYDLFDNFYRYSFIDRNGVLFDSEPLEISDHAFMNYGGVTSALGVHGFVAWDEVSYRNHERCPHYPEDFLGLYVQKFDVQPLGTDPGSVPPATITLNQNYPNPFNPETTISFELPEQAPVNLSIYNLKGQLVRTLIDEAKAPGRHSLVWNGVDERGKQVGSGVYFYKIRAGKFSASRKMVLMK